MPKRMSSKRMSKKMSSKRSSKKMSKKSSKNYSKSVSTSTNYWKGIDLTDKIKSKNLSAIKSKVGLSFRNSVEMP